MKILITEVKKCKQCPHHRIFYENNGPEAIMLCKRTGEMRLTIEEKVHSLKPTDKCPLENK